MKVITICSSLKFIEEIKIHSERLELEGNCVLNIIFGTKNKEDYSQKEIQFLQKAHFKKIDISDAIFVINKNGYIGESVKNEINYAKSINKEIIYLENNELVENKITHNKLVRDNIIDIIENNGKKAIYEILFNEEYIKELNKKLMEEVSEFLENDKVEELADILEVIYAIIVNKNLTIKEVKKIMAKKKEENGSFTKKIFLKEVIE